MASGSGSLSSLDEEFSLVIVYVEVDDVNVVGWIEQIALDFADTVGKIEYDAAGHDGKIALDEGGANARELCDVPARMWIAKKDDVFIFNPAQNCAKQFTTPFDPLPIETFVNGVDRCPVLFDLRW